MHVYIYQVNLSLISQKSGSQKKVPVRANSGFFRYGYWVLLKFISMSGLLNIMS
jgi:hypothetical protein